MRCGFSAVCSNSRAARSQASSKASQQIWSCKKAFQTLSSLRRHQRRIHEHQPLPTGAFKNFRIPQETEGDQPVEMMTQDSPYNNPQDGECMVDISGKVSENLSFYIEGQIVSASSVHNCEVIEMNSGGSAAIGLNAVLISPSQVTQALKLETSASSLTPDLSGQFSTRRRTSTPPMLPPIKTETESESITSASPSPLPSLTVSGVPLGSTHLPQSIETVAGNKETTFYLSPKINDVLENPEGDKATFALIASGSNVGPPLTTTRFKRRTSSPPNSPIQTVELNEDKQDNDSTAPRMSKHESHRMNFLWSEETIPLISPMKSPAQTEQQILPLDSSVSMTYVNLCNQQPLDLSNSVCMPDEAILDLSLNGSKLEYDLAGINLAQSVLNSFKPSVFQNVFRNEQGVVDDNSFEGIASGEAPNLTAGLLSDTGPPNPEDFFFELGLPPTSINPMLAPLSILPAATFPPSSQNFESCLSAPVGEDTNDIQTQPSSISVSENDFEDIPLTTLSQQSDLKVTFPNWGFLAPGDMETQLPIASPHWVTDPSALAQRTLVLRYMLQKKYSLSFRVVLLNVTQIKFLMMKHYNKSHMPHLILLSVAPNCLKQS
ncbi:hypothetical protein DNTS_022685 [Danionella cerebrum]|uniref:C2H2-type domain-containing protein n=1 Tax=Danionella cerebrum TaxID=2873325 RepID=A0A553RKK8_9TELE|nr:hypothetical protein DNTS_022685 [Danionella translucida]